MLKMGRLCLTRYIQYAVNRIQLLRHYGIKPYVVFDGDRLPSKAGTEESREKYVKEQRAARTTALTLDPFTDGATRT